MTDFSTTPYDDLVDMVLMQLKQQHYMDSTLVTYKRTYRRIKEFLQTNAIKDYEPEVGQRFLDNQNVAPSTMSAYACAVRRLNDAYNGKEYRCHHENDTQTICKHFSNLIENYKEDCIQNGNKLGTIIHKQYTCIRFLNYLYENGYDDISSIDVDVITRFLLQLENPDRYADVRLFLKYLKAQDFISKDFSEIIPRNKRPVPIPSVYSIDELKRIEQSIDTSTDTGKRDIAIIQLATRMGLRSGDIAKLRLDEICFLSGYIRFVQEKTSILHELQMPQEVSDSIYMHLENSKKNHYSDGYVFHSMTAPYGRITTSIIRHIVNNCICKAGIDTKNRKHGPHAFRSSLASHMIDDDCSYETVRRILGHTDPNVIKHYAKTDVERLRLCAISPPTPSGLFEDYLSGRRMVYDI